MTKNKLFVRHVAKDKNGVKRSDAQCKKDCHASLRSSVTTTITTM